MSEMMGKPQLMHPYTGFEYKKYLPSAYDSSLDVYEELVMIREYLNQVIIHLNYTTDYVNENVTYMHEKINWMIEEMERFEAHIIDKVLPENLDIILNEWFRNGKLADVINYQVFNMKADKTYVDAKLMEKADLGYVDNKIANIGTSSPKGVYETYQKLANAFPTGTTGIYLVTDDGNWYYWSGTIWAVGGKYQTSGMSDGYVTPNKTSFMEAGKNKFDKSKALYGYYIHGTSGALTPSLPAYPSYASDHVKVISGSTMVFSIGGKITSSQHAFYRADGTNIAGTGGSKSIVIVPDGAYTVRFTITEKDVDLFQFENGSNPTSFEKFQYVIPTLSVKNTNIEDNQIQREKLAFITPEMLNGKNKFNKTTAQYGYYVSELNGNLIPHKDPWLFYASDWIEVEGNKKYHRPDNEPMAYYNGDRIFLSGDKANQTTLSPPEARWARVSISSTKIDSYQFEVGDKGTSYEPYGFRIKGLLEDEKPSSDFIVIDVPDVIDIGVGRTIEIYDKQIIYTNIPEYYVSYVSSVGRQLKDKYQIEGKQNIIGIKTLTIKVMDYNAKVLASKVISLNIVSKSSGDVDMLCVGDSLTDIPDWREELKLLTDNMIGTNSLNYIGTKGSGQYKHEGMSGWRTWSFIEDTNYTFGGNIIVTVSGIINEPQSKKQYRIPDNQGNHVWEVEKVEKDGSGNIIKIYMNRTVNGTFQLNGSGKMTAVDNSIPGDAEITYSSWMWQPGNPFWNPETKQLDFNYYLTKNSFNKPDVVSYYIGANDFGAIAGDVSGITTKLKDSVDNVKVFVNKLTSQWTGTKVMLIQTPFWADQNGLGRNYVNMDINGQHTMDLKVFIYNRMLREAFANNPNVKIVGIAQTMDRVNNYDSKEFPVNPRSSITELQATGGVHPGKSGFLQMADTMFGSLLAVI